MLDINSDGILTKEEFQAVLNYNNKNLKFNEADMQLFVIHFLNLIYRLNELVV